MMKRKLIKVSQQLSTNKFIKLEPFKADGEKFAAVNIDKGKKG